MCGICGIISDKIASSPGAVEALDRMLKPLERRGPDESGRAKLGPALIGHRRLKVIDLAGGKQPMVGCGGNVVLTFNGEIYNFRQLRITLEEHGYHFYSSSDTEVLLNGYLHWGYTVVDHLNGMFAFAVWDDRTQELFLARDRVGKKPLYWAELPGSGFIFGSELSSICQSGLVAPYMNRQAAWRYLALGYVLGSESIVRNIYRLPPASYLRWKPGGSPVIVEYWNLAELWRQGASQRSPQQESLSRFEYLLTDSLKLRLVADVPLGAFLSGGIDSSTICALIKPVKPEVKTISIGFTENSYDESQYAEMVAAHLGIEHHLTRLNGVTVQQLEHIYSQLDEPLADTSMIPTYFLCKEAREQFTVAVSGDGADELLGGYATSQADMYYRYLAKFPRVLVKLFRFVLDGIPESRKKVNFLFKSKQFLKAHGYTACDAHAMWRMLLPEGSNVEAGRENVLEDIFAVFRRHYNAATGLGELERFLYVDYKTWLVDDILVKVDRASMNHGLEVRSPYLDYRLIEYCAGLPDTMKVHGPNGKWLLKRFAERYLPKQIINRSKSGFNSPVSEWLVTCWRERAESAFSRKSLNDLNVLPSETGTRLWEEHLSGQKDNGYFLFGLLVLDIWCRQNPLIVH